MRMSKKLFALVKWIGGEDDKKYSPDVPVSWIKGFDIKDFESDKYDVSLSFVIEWHGTKKEPPGGWPVYDGYVITVSPNMAVLRNKLKALDGLLSPRKAVILPNEGNENTAKNLEDSDNRTGTNLESSNEKNCSTLTTNTNERDEKAGPSKASASSRSAISTKEQGFEESAGDHSSNDDIDKIPECTSLLEKRRTKMQLYKAAPTNSGTSSNIRSNEATSIGDALIAIHAELKRLRKKSSDSTDSSASSDDEGHEIGRKGSGIFVTNQQWMEAKTAKSYTAMGKTLLLSLFPMEVLLKSNLRGGHCKVRKEEGKSAYAALDTKILDALYYTVQKHWKRTFSKGGLGIAINAKLAQLRAHQKKSAVDTNETSTTQN